ncbi:MAG: hypothetical protein GF411_05185 [Candidatus Lokiarchaeota archaeon]|nr:hypothetical protein [Candidatus Lokiarchaeota archaeon]
MFSKIDLIIMACMYREDRIGKHHGNIENILKFCVPKEYRDRHRMSKVKKGMRRLASRGYLILKQGRFEAFALTIEGVRVVERWIDGWSLDQINDAEEQGQ